MAMIGKVRRMYFREKKSVREIVRLTSLSRNTVRKWLKTPVLEEPRYRHSEAPGKLTAHHETLKLALKADAHRPRHERRTARALYEQIRRDGYAGCYSRVSDFVRAWRQGEGQSISAKAFVPLVFELGEAFPFDWSNVASGWEKGVVEKNVQDSRRRIWIEANKVKFGSFTELNAWLGSAAGRCGRRYATPSTTSSAWPRCWTTSGRT